MVVQDAAGRSCLSPAFACRKRSCEFSVPVFTPSRPRGLRWLPTLDDMSSWLGSQPACLSNSRYERVVFTLGNAKYHHLVRPWSARIESFGWRHQVFVALDDVAANISRQVPTLCTVTYSGGADSLRLRPTASAAKFHTEGDPNRLPPTVGGAKFGMMLYLLRRQHGAVVLTEMDVFWFRDPWPEIHQTLQARQFAAQDNYPWSPGRANIGFVAARPHRLTFDLFDEIKRAWVERRHLLLSMNLTTPVAEDQKVLNDVLHLRQNLFAAAAGVENISWVLSRYKFPSINVQDRRSTTVRFWWDPTPTIAPSTNPITFWRRWSPALSNVRPHAHLTDSLCVLHAAGVREEVKMQLLQLLYQESERQIGATEPSQVVQSSPRLILSDANNFCGATWGEIAARIVAQTNGVGETFIKPRDVASLRKTKALRAAPRPQILDDSAGPGVNETQRPVYLYVN